MLQIIRERGNLMIILKPTIAFILILILTRILGKKQMSQMTFFNYVTGITIGSLAANIITFDDKTITDEVIGLIWWCFLTGLLAFITLKSNIMRLIIDGQPAILIKNGLFQEKMMKRTRISIEDLTMMLREQNIFSIKEVDYAILEPNGKLSVLKYQDQLNVIKKDLKIPTTQPKYLPAQIIIDGKVILKNLNRYGLDMVWLDKKLKKQNYDNIENVFYAEIQDDGSLYVVLKDNN